MMAAVADYKENLYILVGMCQIWRTVWVVSLACVTSEAQTNTLPMQATISPQARALNIDDRQSSYLPYQQQYPSGPYGPPPTYGPPPPPLPTGMVRLEFVFDEIVIRCIAEEPFEHIVWTRNPCPQQFLYGGEGVRVAEGATVHQEDLYDVHIRGHDGTIISELMIKQPLADDSAGIYQCEVWPHIHQGGGAYFNPYQNYNAPKSEVFIIGGNSLLENCYHVNYLGSPIGKISGIADKHGNKESVFSLKPRRNTTAESRKDSNSKQLRYNLKFDNNSLYNVEGVNVTADFFRPSKNIPFNLLNLHNNVSYQSSGLKYSNNFQASDYFSGRSNDKFKEIFPKLNTRRGKVSDNFLSNSSIQDSDNKVL